MCNTADGLLFALRLRKWQADKEVIALWLVVIRPTVVIDFVDSNAVKNKPVTLTSVGQWRFTESVSGQFAYEVRNKIIQRRGVAAVLFLPVGECKSQQ